METIINHVKAISGHAGGVSGDAAARLVITGKSDTVADLVELVRFSLIAAVSGCDLETVKKICAPDYWAVRGDVTQAEHESWLKSETIGEIAGWVRSVAADMKSEVA